MSLLQSSEKQWGGGGAVTGGFSIGRARDEGLPASVIAARGQDMRKAMSQSFLRFSVCLAVLRIAGRALHAPVGTLPPSTPIQFL